MSYGEDLIAAATGGGLSLARMEVARLFWCAQQRLSRRGRAAAEVARLATAFAEGTDEGLAEELRQLSAEDKSAAAAQLDEALTDQPDDPSETAEIHELARTVIRNSGALAIGDRAQSAQAGIVLQPQGDIIFNQPPVAVPVLPRSQRVLIGTIPRLADEYQPRSTISAELEPAFRPGATVVLTGTAGNGKTQLAAAMARAVRDSGAAELVIWAQATSRDSIQAVYAKAARTLELVAANASVDDASEAMVNWFETTEQSWLVVLDDLADPDDLVELWPSGPHGWTLITTQRRDPELRQQQRVLVEVEQFNRAEAAGYLKAKLKPEQLPEAAELAKELGYLPLALAQACAVIVDEESSCAEYRRQFADKHRSLVELMPPDRRADGYATGPHAAQRATLATTWQIAIDRANAIRPHGVAKPLLELASYLDPNGIPAAVFETEAALDHVRQQAGEVAPTVIVPGLRALQRLSLITRTDDGSIRVHGLVQRAVRDSLQSDNEQSARRVAATALLEAWPDDDYQPQHALLAASLRANAEALENAAEPSLWTFNQRKVLYRTGQSLYTGGLPSAAVVFWEAQHEKASQILGPSAQGTLAIRNELALAYRLAGRLTDALLMLEICLEESEVVLGKDHPNTLTSRNNLANAYRDSDRLAEALPLYEAVLTDSVRLLGPDDPDTLISRNNLASAYQAAGRLTDAISLLEATVRDRERILGPDHPHTLVSRNNLASAYQDAGRLADAVPLYEATVRDRERILGPDHPNALVSRNNLASAYQDAGRLADALSLYEATLQDSERILGPDHPRTEVIRRNLAYCRAQVERQAGEH